MKPEDLEDLFWGAFLEKHRMSNTLGRRQILRALHGDMLPATELTKITQMTPMAVYSFLKGIVGKGWVEKKGRRPTLYKLTVNLPGRLPSMSITDDSPKVVLSIGKKTTLTIAFQSEADLGIRLVHGNGAGRGERELQQGGHTNLRA